MSRPCETSFIYLLVQLLSSLALRKNAQICHDGDLIVGGLLWMTNNDYYWHPSKTNHTVCPKPSAYFVIRSESILFALERANAELRSRVCIELGFWAFQVCSSDSIDEMPIMREFVYAAPHDGIFVHPPCARGRRQRRLLALAGMTTSNLIVKLADSGVTTHVPILSTCATMTSLRAKDNVLTTQPLNDIEAQAIVSILLHFGVTKVTIAVAQVVHAFLDDLTKNLLQVLATHAKQVQVETVIVTANASLDELTGDAVVVNVDHENFFRQLSLKPKRPKLFIVNDGVSAILYPRISDSAVLAAMRNTIGVGQFQLVENNDEFDAHLRNVTLAQSCDRNPWLTMLIAEQHGSCAFNCSHSGFSVVECNGSRPCCTGDEKLVIGPQERHAIRNAHFDRMAAASIQRAVVELHRLYCNGVCGACDRLQKVFADVLFDTILGTMSGRNAVNESDFDSRKSGPPFFTVSQFRQSSDGTYEWVNLGTFDGSEPLTADNYDERLRNVSFGNFTVSEPGSTISYLHIVIPITAMLIVALIVGVVLLKLRDNKKLDKVKMLEQMQEGLTKRQGAMLNPYVSFSYEPRLPNYDSSYELEPENLHYDKILGSGNFGRVFRGYYLSQHKVEPVAVKTPLHSFVCKELICELNCMLAEIQAMQAVGRHTNVLNLIGCITRNLCKGELQIVTPFCKYGNALKFLQDRSAKFVDELLNHREDECHFQEKAATITSDYVAATRSSPLHCSEVFEKHLKSLERPSFARLQQPHMWKLSKETLTSSDLFAIGYQIACGMEFLSQKRTMPVPRNWMPIETLERNDFTTKSDVWSFGVLLWEIFTLGQPPYESVDEDVLHFLKSGNRLEKPDNATAEIHALMNKCWLAEPGQRPTFSHCKEELYISLLKEFPLVHSRLIEFLSRSEEEINASLLVEIPINSVDISRDHDVFVA